MGQSDIVEQLYALILERREQRPEKSYVVRLFDGGVDKIGGKIVEEAAELVESAATDDDEHTVYEAADLLFHALVLLGHKDIEPQRVLAELQRRFGVSGLVEKASRSDTKN